MALEKFSFKGFLVSFSTNGPVHAVAVVHSLVREQNQGLEPDGPHQMNLLVCGVTQICDHCQQSGSNCFEPG